MEVLEGLMFHLRKAGINLNQLAHRENAADLGGAAPPPADAEIEEATQAIREVVRLIRDRMVPPELAHRRRAG
ncbi:MAG TPA: plasmid mobilization relaxosome protein MobC [Longimicrobiaceae bacterium]|nr:plasmid mobilization relaxosome protein MobC [Longimicrobiaceae bacterium]